MYLKAEAEHWTVIEHQRTTDTQMISKYEFMFEICDSLLLLLLLNTMLKSREPIKFKTWVALTQIHQVLRVAYAGWLRDLELKYTLEKEETKILFSLQQPHTFKAP